MLQVKGPLKPTNMERAEHASGLAEGIKSFAIVRRQLPIFLVLIPLAAALGWLYLLNTPQSYTAVAKLVIDMRRVQDFQQQQKLGETIDVAAVATQAEVLMSESVSLAVIKDLKLNEDPEFINPSAGFIGSFFNPIFRMFDSGIAPSGMQLQRRALASFESRRKITHLPQTYVMEVSFRSLDPDKAAQIANAIGDAYIADQLEAKYESARRASAWLQDRIKSLRDAASAAEQALSKFKENNNIVESGGKLMNDQQMSEITSQLILAHAAAVEAKARLDRIRQIMSQDVANSSLTDSLKSEVIIKLRQQYLELAAREAIWSKQYGHNHLAAIALRNQMLESRRNIADEMGKIAESYKSDYEISLARETSIKNSLDNVVAESRVTNQGQGQQRELESNAHAARTIYENFLQRYMESVQQQSFPVSEARLITPAAPPSNPSHPKPLLVLVVTAAGGVVAAFGAAILREAFDPTFRTGAQLENVLHVNCVAMLPLIKPVKSVAPNVADKHDDAACLGKPRCITRSNNLLHYVVEAPFSQFTELLRSLKVTADFNHILKANRVIGVTSSLPNEGKSTIAANFAALIAHAGSRVILIDADLRSPALSRDLAPSASVGLIEVVAGGTALNDAIWSDDLTGLSFLPAGPHSTKLLHPNEILASVALKSMIDNLRREFEYIIVDFPPLAPVVDTRTTIGFIDSYIYVIEWGRTKIDVVEHCLSTAHEVYDRLLGVVLNKANMSVLQRYERYRTTYYYRKYPSNVE